MLTTWVNKKNVQKNWYIIDAKDAAVGRLASYISKVLSILKIILFIPQCQKTSKNKLIFISKKYNF